MTGWDSLGEAAEPAEAVREPRPGRAPGAGRAADPLRDSEPAAERWIGVAIPIPDPYGAELQRARGALGDPLADAIPTHITLLPPTEVAGVGALAAVEHHLRAVAGAERPFRIRLSGTGTFRPVSPVVFVALAEGAVGCERLQQRVLSGPLVRRLAFPYHPHVTVAHHLPEEVMDRAYKELAGYEAEFTVGGFSLYEHGVDGVWRPRSHFAFSG